MKKIYAAITVSFEASDDADAWELVQWIVTGGTMVLFRKGGREILPRIISATVNGKPVKRKVRNGRVASHD